MSEQQFTFTIKVVLIDALIYFADKICTLNAVVHLVFGVFFGFVLGHTRPRLAFWTACFIGFSKETIDYFKHTYESNTFNYLTDMKYGILDGFGDWFFWMLGGFVAYKLLKRVHDIAHSKAHAQQAENLQNIIKAQTVALLNTTEPELIPITVHNVPSPARSAAETWQMDR